MGIWLERDSLRKLVGYSEHPLYSQCIKHVTFATDRLNPYFFNEGGAPNPDGGLRDVKKARDIVALYQQANATIYDEYARSHPTEKETTIRAKRLVERLEYQKRMEKEELDVMLLSKAFKKLPRLADIVFDNENSPFEATQLALEGFDFDDPGAAWRRHVMQIGLKALANAGCKPTTIMVLTDRLRDRYSPSWAFDDLSLAIPKVELSALVQNLRLFRFDGTMDMEIERENSLYEGAIAQFLENASLLEHIFLYSVGEIYKDRDTVSPFLGRLQYRRLRTIGLSKMFFCERDLATWILMHSDTLEAIDLSNDCLIEGDWVDFLDSLRSKSWPQLSYIRLKMVSVEDSAGDFTLWNWEHGSLPLVDYVQKKSDTNPYLVYHPGWFPELFGTHTKSG